MWRCLIATSLIFALSITTPQAQTRLDPIELILPGPLSVVVAVGRWIVNLSNKQKVYVITVQCQGNTESQARQNCFQLAIEQAVGSLLLSETHVRDGRMVRRDIYDYSSGYIDNFKVLTKQTHDEQVILTMEVTVAGSRIADRIVTKASDTATINGDQLATATTTFLEQQRKGTQVIATVAKDFTAQAFNIKVIKMDVMQNSARGVDVRLEYDMSWNWKYLQSLNEVLKVTAEDVSDSDPLIFKVVANMKNPDQFLFGTMYKHNFRDAAKFAVLEQHMVKVKPALRVDIFDDNNLLVHRQCWGMSEEFYMFSNASRHPTLFINGNFVDHRFVEIPNVNTALLPRYRRATMSVVPANQCKLV